MKKLVHIVYVKLARVYFWVRFVMLSAQQVLKRLPDNRPKIVFHLTDERLYRDGDGSGRYAYLTMNLFSEGGYNVYFYKNLNFTGFMGLGRYGRFSYYVKNLKFIAQLPRDTENYILAFDTIDKGILDKKWKKRIYVNVLKPTNCKVGDVIWIPYFLHPYMYKLNQNKSVLKMRETPKKMKAFFGGNTIAKYYSSHALEKYYGKMNRLEGVQALSEVGDKVKFDDKMGDYSAILNGDEYHNKCFIFRTDKAGFIRHEDWSRVVAASDFFVCLSGTDLPMCHNAIESMAVGTIPIISYADWFFPALEHRKNAIIYTDKADMLQKINEVLAMNRDEIAALRKNVLEYYDRNLVPLSFIANVEGTSDADATIMLHPRLNPTPQEQEVGRIALEEIHRYFLEQKETCTGKGR